MSSAGNIKFIVGTAYPAWCELYLDGRKVGQLHHSELADLLYVTKQAMKEARRVLGDDADEV